MAMPSRDMDPKDAGEAPSPDEDSASLQTQDSFAADEEEEKRSSSRLELSSMAARREGAPIVESTRDEESQIAPPAPSSSKSEPGLRLQSGPTVSSPKTSDEEFTSRFVIPEHLRKAMAIAVESQQTDSPPIAVPEGVKAPSHPIIVMINSRSGGRKGPVLRDILHDLLSKEQVYDLATIPPPVFFRYGLACLEKLAESGDQCAKETRNNIRIIVAGGDGTVGWVLGGLAELHVEQRTPVPSVGIIPLGTGNDLARSFGEAPFRLPGDGL